MKKKFALLNLSLLFAVLSSILFQSVHSFEHIVAEFTEHKCEHSHATGKDQITHQHHNFDHCYSCEFSFSNFVAPQIFEFSFFAPYKTIPYFFTVPETPTAFSGSSYALRGPPFFIV
ncbi:hypothetical protein [Flavobacterium sp.]|uniref:hypothetical protein n=1 Tax=Flavobacterium sp. TaxID=239 RepID=UPI0039E504AD